ncbi:MAG: anhydro-N-acetylmuramic acid kinase [Rhodobacteraceae bacterium]|nr:anhydro-N-acetylmuramic acid kinase [Paracoccaceae bacterium]
MTRSGPIWALGAMSGTSLDGVDAAMLRTDGERIEEFGKTGYRPYSTEERTTIWAALGRWPGDPGVEDAAEVVEEAHLDLLRRFRGVDLVGFHGQTLAHDPAGGRTHQTGRGDRLAHMLKLPVVWDFRSTDMNMGGEGAPLAPFFHFACAKWIGAERPLAFLNLGGVGNLTWVNPAKERPEQSGACLAFDTGPANAPINDLLRHRRGAEADIDGALAAEGKVAEPVIEAFLQDDFFERQPPKSLDRDQFNQLPALIEDLSDADAAATLTASAAVSVSRGFSHVPTMPERILVTGGGRKNRTLMGMIASRVNCPVVPVEDAGLDGDMLEAQAFAFLAVRVARGLPTSCPATTGVATPIGGGILSRPR